MSTTAQINANRENAKLSTGPTSQAGSERSSRNALRHGYTGQTMVLTPEEAEAYAAHVAFYMDSYQPADDYHRNLVQQLADADWGVHQIFTAQTAQVSLLNTLTRQLSEAGADTAFIIKSSAQCARTLATLTRYENGKRRTSKLIKQQLDQLSEAANSNTTNEEATIGFVHPSPAKPPSPQSAQQRQEEMEAFVQLRAAGLTAEEAYEILKNDGLGR